MSRLTLTGAGGGGIVPIGTYEGAYINRSGETNSSNKTISLKFSGAVPTGSNYTTGITIEVTGDNRYNYETLDLSETTQAIVDTNYLQYTLTGTVDTFQGLSGTDGHQVRISYDGSQSWNEGTITNIVTLNNNSTINLLDDIVEAWHMSDESAAISSANDMTNTNSVVVDAKLGSGMQMSRTGPKYLSHTDSTVFSRQDTNFSWSLWVKFDAVDLWQYLVTKWNWSGSSGAEYMIYTEVSNSAVRFIKRVGGTNTAVLHGTVLDSTSTWYNIVAYHDADNDLMGINVNDGTLVTAASSTGVDDGVLDIAFGSSSEGDAAGSVEGIMDEIALHSKVLSSAEITDLYNDGDGKAYPYIPDDNALTYEGAYINRSGETNGSNNTISLKFTEAVPTGSNYTTGMTIEITGDNGVTYETLDLVSTTQAVVNTNYVQYTLTGTVDTFQGLSGTDGHQVKISYDGSQTWNSGTITDITTLTNASTINLLEDIVEVWHLADLTAEKDSANDLTNNNSTTFVTGKLGNAVDLEKDSNHTLSLADNADVSFNDEDFSVSCWVKHETVVAWMGHMVKANWSGGTPEWNLSLQNDSEFKFQTWGASSYDQVDSGIVPSTATWYLVVGYLDTSTELGISVNGATPVTEAYTGGVRDSTQDFVIGGYSDYDSAGVFDGLIDEATIWGKVLSTAEITDLYNEKVGTAHGKWYPYLPDYFSPSDISGLSLFLETDRGVVTTSTKVTDWKDEQLGSHRDVTQITDGNRPIETASIFGTHPGLRFDGSNDRLDRATDAALEFDYTDPFYVIMGIKMGEDYSTGGVCQIAGQFGLSGAAGWNCRIFSDGKLQFILQNAFGGGTGAYTSVLGETILEASGSYLIEMWSTAYTDPFVYTDLNIWINGLDDNPTEQWDGLGSSTIAGGGNPFNIGERHDGVHNALIDVACVGVYNAIPTHAERIKLRSYLSKYGFSNAEDLTLQTGLHAYYKFNDATDSTGNWDLTAVNTPTYSSASSAVSGKTGSYVQIESDNSQYFSNSSFNSLHGATKATWMFFIKPESFVSSAGIAGEFDQSDSTSNWLVDTGPTGSKIAVFGGGNADGGGYAYRRTNDVVLTVGTWTHVRITLDTTQSTIADQCHIYINGDETSYGGLTGSGDSTRFVTLPSNTARTFGVGGYENGSWTYTMDGDIDEFGIWDRIVDDTEAAGHRNGTRLPYNVYFNINDTFTGSDGTALTSHTSASNISPWVFQEAYDGNTGAIDIQTNRAECRNYSTGTYPDGIVNLATIDSGVSDCLISTTIQWASLGTITTDGIVFRYVNEDNYWWAGPTTYQYNYFRVIKVEGGVNSLEQVARSASVVDTSYEITVRLDGDDIVAELDGALTISITSDHCASATKHGITGWTQDTSQQAQFDNFEVTQI